MRLAQRRKRIASDTTCRSGFAESSEQSHQRHTEVEAIQAEHLKTRLIQSAQAGRGCLLTITKIKNIDSKKRHLIVVFQAN